MGTSGAFIAVCVAALIEAGPSTMASLVRTVISSLFQFLLAAARLSLLRRIFTLDARWVTDPVWLMPGFDDAGLLLAL